jgi:heptosyltransferase I
MATAVGTPVIGLYATSNRMRTGPYLSQRWVVDHYPDAVRKEFGVEVDRLPWGARVRDPDAMDLIRVEEVTARLDQLFTSVTQGEKS